MTQTATIKPDGAREKVLATALRLFETARREVGPGTPHYMGLDLHRLAEAATGLSKQQTPAFDLLLRPE